MFVLWDKRYVVKLWQNIWEMHEAKRANSDDLIFTYFVTTAHVTRNQNFLASNYLLHNLRHSHTKDALNSDVSAEQFKFKNSSVENFVVV